MNELADREVNGPRAIAASSLQNSRARRFGYWELVWILVLGLWDFASAASPAPRDGLILWYDVGAQNSLRQTAALPQLSRFAPVDFLLDGSGAHRDAFQAVAERRPVFNSDGKAAFLGFDGKDDFLALHGPHTTASNITLFVLAAPKSNEGNFTGLFGACERGKNDYTSGLNFDFGPTRTAELSVFNVEGAGAIGFRNLLTPGFLNAASRPFKDFHVFTVRAKAGKNGIETFLDGFKGGERDRGEMPISLDDIVIGGRIYSNDPNQPPFAQGSIDGGVAEVLLYNRALSDDERRAVEQGLLSKTVALNALLHGSTGHALETVKNPPVVQMLVPGFSVQELPVKVSNLDNVRYRRDGKLVALGYDGRIHLLSDTDGDGLEDKDELFWDKPTLRGPIGMALTRADDPRGDGIYVASKGKLSLIIDKDRDGRADEEIVLASGWNELPHGVDTLGVALAKDGSVYFGLGCANFVDAYQIDRTSGRSRYDRNEIHGTIQRLAPGATKPETICTGVRFTCALAFNRDGDLFATDQEGATWLPNGNPLDELLHIERGKHYGFPPRHPRHLPDVIDEPAISEYAPQHQSTVGMVFNEGVNGGPHFGPAHWQGDALICGESRGKIWRTKLAKTPLGYVAQNHLIACLGMLTVDACVSPKGDLVVACHSGPPDWGTGPAGQGRIFKIRYTGRDLPQPVVAWAAAADEFRVAFDRPLDAADWANAKDRIKIEAGAYVNAGDRFEVIRPGYQVVRDQMATPRRWVDVLSLSLTEDRRNLVLRVPRQTEAVSYAISLPLPEKWKQPSTVAQQPQIDVLATLNGVQCTVTANGATKSAIIPHSSLGASKALTVGSADHEAFFNAAAVPEAVLSIRTVGNTGNPFVPAVQPGAKLDWNMATDPFASTTFDVMSDYAGPSAVAKTINAATQPNEPGRVKRQESLNAARAKQNESPHVDFYEMVQIDHITNASFGANGLFVAHDELRHSLATTKLRVPWAIEARSDSTNVALASTRTDVKGNWLAGRRVFFGDGGCATCHTIRGEGIAFGPDLSNLIFRDRDSVLHDILEPSATINPDHTGTVLALLNGSTQSGIIRRLDATKVVLGLPAGAQLEFPRKDVRNIEPMKTSLMPAGLGEQLSKGQIEDLLTFLLVNPLEPATITRTEPPIPTARSMREIADVLGANPQPPNNPTPLKILLCSGPKDHGTDEHDYPQWLDRWSRLLALAEKVTVKTATGFPPADRLGWADVAVFYNANPDWNAEKAAQLDAFHKRGGGAVYLHYAVDGGKDPASVAERMGLTFTLGSRFRHGEFDLVFAPSEHPITRGFPTLHFTDETYWNMRGEVRRLNVLGTVVEEGAPRPELWTMERNRSRIVVSIPGHYTWTFDDPLYRLLVLRAICWAARQENVDRLAELAVVGARMSGASL